MKLKNILKESKENNRQYVYRILKENIMNLHLEPGEAISEGEIGEYLGVSRTPIREAIVKLGEERLLNVYPQRGSFVSKIDLDLVRESLFMRRTLEKEILLLAMDRGITETLIKNLDKNLHFQKVLFKLDEDLHEVFYLDNEFHKIIFKEYNKERVWDAIKQLSTHYDRLRLLDALEKTTLEKTIDQHNLIIDILKNKRAGDVDLVITDHLSNFEKVIDTLKAKYPTYFIEA